MGSSLLVNRKFESSLYSSPQESHSIMHFSQRLTAFKTTRSHKLKRLDIESLSLCNNIGLFFQSMKVLLGSSIFLLVKGFPDPPRIKELDSFRKMLDLLPIELLLIIAENVRNASLLTKKRH